MHNKYIGIPLIATAMTLPASAGEEPVAAAAAITPAQKELPSVRLEPTLHFRAAHGQTSLPQGKEGLFGGHDPDEDGFNFQGFELGVNIHAGEYVEGFATVNIFKNDGEDFDSEFEEGFLKLINLPGGFEIRAGRLLARFGDQNAKHLHAWDFADVNLTTLRFLGEEGFAYDGGELTWLVPTSWDDSLSIGFGSAVEHDHEEEEEHDEEEEEEGEDEHGHNEEAEMARPVDDIVVIRYQAKFGPNDFHRFQAGASFLTGDNGFGMTTNIYGADFTYTWRQNGLEPGGQQFKWRTEWVMLDAETDEGSFDEYGITTELLWEFIENWEAGIRYGYLEGVTDPELAMRERISVSLARRFTLAQDLTGIVRLQWNHDDIHEYGSADSFWIQFGFDWGPGEIR